MNDEHIHTWELVCKTYEPPYTRNTWMQPISGGPQFYDVQEPGKTSVLFRCLDASCCETKLVTMLGKESDAKP